MKIRVIFLTLIISMFFVGTAEARIDLWATVSEPTMNNTEVVTTPWRVVGGVNSSNMILKRIDIDNLSRVYNGYGEFYLDYKTSANGVVNSVRVNSAGIPGTVRFGYDSSRDIYAKQIHSYRLRISYFFTDRPSYVGGKSQASVVKEIWQDTNTGGSVEVDPIANDLGNGTVGSGDSNTGSNGGTVPNVVPTSADGIWIKDDEQEVSGWYLVPSGTKEVWFSFVAESRGNFYIEYYVNGVSHLLTDWEAYDLKPHNQVRNYSILHGAGISPDYTFNVSAVDRLRLRTHESVSNRVYVVLSRVVGSYGDYNFEVPGGIGNNPGEPSVPNPPEPPLPDPATIPGWLGDNPYYQVPDFEVPVYKPPVIVAPPELPSLPDIFVIELDDLTGQDGGSRPDDREYWWFDDDGHPILPKPPSIPDLPGQVDSPLTPDAPSQGDPPLTPDLPGQGDAPMIPDSPGQGDSPMVPDSPGQGDSPMTPDSPGQGDAPLVPDSPGQGDGPMVPDAPGQVDDPMIPDAPMAPDSMTPDAPMIPDSPLTPGIYPD